MTKDEDEDEATTAGTSRQSSTLPGPWWNALWIRYGAWRRSTTTKGTVTLVLVFIGVGFQFVLHQQHQVDVAARKRDAREAAAALYNTQLTAYSNAKNGYDLCVTTAEVSTENRAQWSDLVEVIRALGPNVAVLADRVNSGPLLTSPPRSADACEPPPTPPTPPTDP
jgi:hypothetical protein